eukprot:gene10707-11883_t
MEGDSVTKKLNATPVREVVIDIVAALRIVKHCNDNLPSMVAGCLLGLDVDGVLEVTYAYAFPQPKAEGETANEGDDIDGSDYQIEMMKMLRDVNVDNNCVGWYQSMYMGTVYTNDVVAYQYSYQSSEELSENSVVIMYDPVLSKGGDLVLKAYRLSDQFMEAKRSKSNKFVKPSEILEEIPLTIRSQGHVSAAVVTLAESHADDLDVEFDSLSMSNVDGQTEKQMELLAAWMDDLLGEQQRFQGYARSNAKLRQEHLRWLVKRRQENEDARENGEEEQPLRLDQSGLKALPELPPRNEHLLLVAQVEKYTGQLNEIAQEALQKVALTNEVNPIAAGSQ